MPPRAPHCPGHWGYKGVVRGPRLQGSPPGSTGAARRSQAGRGNRIPAPFAAGERSGRGLANGQATGFREVSWMHLSSPPGRYQLGHRVPRGGERRGPAGAGRAEVPTAVPAAGGASALPRPHQRYGHNDGHWARVSRAGVSEGTV